MHDFDQVALRSHHCINRFVGRRGFVNHAGVLAALDAFGHVLVILDGETPLRLAAGHGAAGAVAAAHKTLRIALAPDDVGTRAHAAGYDAEIAFTGTDCAFASH